MSCHWLRPRLGARTAGCRVRRRGRGRRGWRRRRCRADDLGCLTISVGAHHARRQSRRTLRWNRAGGPVGGNSDDGRNIEGSRRNDNGHKVHASQVLCHWFRRLRTTAPGRSVGCRIRGWRGRGRRRGWRRRDDFGLLTSHGRTSHAWRRGRGALRLGWIAGRMRCCPDNCRDIEVRRRNDDGHKVHASHALYDWFRQHFCDWPEFSRKPKSTDFKKPTERPGYVVKSSGETIWRKVKSTARPSFQRAPSAAQPWMASGVRFFARVSNRSS